MKTMTPREQRLAKISAFCLMAAITYFILDRQLKQYRSLREQGNALRLEATRQAELIAREPELWQQLENIRVQLPSHPLSKDLKPEFARRLDALTNSSGLQLTTVTPRPEIFLEELGLYQSTFRCKWKGSSRQLIQTLVELQNQGLGADIRELMIQNRTGSSEGLTGTFTLDFIYTRIPDASSEEISEGSPS